MPHRLLDDPATEAEVAGNLAVMLPMFAVYAARSSSSHLGPIGDLLRQDLPEEVGGWEGEPTDLVALLDMSRPEATTLTLRHRGATLDEAALRGMGRFALGKIGVAYSVDLGEHWDREDAPESERRRMQIELVLRIVGRPEILRDARGEATGARLTYQAKLRALYVPPSCGT